MNNDPYESFHSLLGKWKENNDLFCNNFQKTFIFDENNKDNLIIFTMDILNLNHSPNILIEIEKETHNDNSVVVLVANQKNTNNNKHIENILSLIEKKFKELNK